MTKRKKLENIYQGALRVVVKKTKNYCQFPLNCPYTLEQLLDQDWFPSKQRI
jgi:hypothetical protein